MDSHNLTEWEQKAIRAMQGIEDPAEFVQCADELAKLHREGGKDKTYPVRRVNGLNAYRKARGPTSKTKEVDGE